MKDNKIFKKILNDTMKIYEIFIEYDENNLKVDNAKVFLNVWGKVFRKGENGSWGEVKFSI